MEKPATKSSKNKILKSLTRAASAITFHNLPFSPGRNKKAVVVADKLKSHLSQEVSGPNLWKNSSFESQEPTSPKISCMGHIKHRKKIAKNMHLLVLKDMNHHHHPFSSAIGSKNKLSMMKPVSFLPDAKNIPSRMQKGGLNNVKPGRKSDFCGAKSSLHDRAPSLSQMKRFASCRGSILDNFDWRMVQNELEDMDELHEEREDHSYGEEEEEEEEEAVVPFFHGGPSVGLVPRKEVNLWKRRTIDQPKPLEIHTTARMHR